MDSAILFLCVLGLCPMAVRAEILPKCVPHCEDLNCTNGQVTHCDGFGCFCGDKPPPPPPCQRAKRAYACNSPPDCKPDSCLDSLNTPVCYTGICGCAESPLGKRESVAEAPECQLDIDCGDYAKQCDENNLLPICAVVADGKSRCLCLVRNGDVY